MKNNLSVNQCYVIELLSVDELYFLAQTVASLALTPKEEQLDMWSLFAIILVWPASRPGSSVFSSYSA